MELGRLFLFGLAGVMAIGCGEDDVPLQVDFEYQVNCIDIGGGCSPRDRVLSGKNGDPIPDLANATLGIECEIVEAGDTKVLTSLKIQDQPITVPQPSNGIHIRNGTLSLGSSMSCDPDAIQVFDENEFSGDCAGVQDGSCAVLVNEYSKKKGRVVLQIDCRNLPSIAGAVQRSVADGLITIQGCNVTEDTR